MHVQNGIKQGHFSRPELIEALTVNFARCYLDAFYANDEQMPIMKAWYVVFNAARHPNPCVLPHILLGINPISIWT